MAVIVNNRVQEFRNKSRTTQEELAKSVSVTRQTIIAIEKGNYTPSVVLALKLSKFFKTTVEKLFIMEE
ncbi:MAG: helix-turn-helix transcriptional regulator [Candidatus Shapirobacteria bacterium]|jgi:putative transcriptional regulator